MKAGFTLFECLIYVSCSALFSLFLCIFVHQIFGKLKTVTHNTDKYLSCVCAHDYVMQDLYYAPSHPQDWKYIGTNTVVWHEQELDYGYALEHKKLIRSTGVFDTSQQKWHKRVRSIVTENIDELIFKLHYHDNTIIGVECIMRTGTLSLQRFAACLSGSIICNS